MLILYLKKKNSSYTYSDTLMHIHEVQRQSSAKQKHVIAIRNDCQNVQYYKSLSKIKRSKKFSILLTFTKSIILS